MNDDLAPPWIVDRLRANLRTAEVPLTERDLEGILQIGLLGTALAFEELDDDIPHNTLPDYLWAPDDYPPFVSGAPPASEPSPDAPTNDQARAIPAAPPEDSITAIAVRIRAREISPVELTERALARIEALDRDLNAFQLVMRDDALSAARQAERSLADGRYQGPLHGVPVAVKDLMGVVGTPTTAGSKFGDVSTAQGDASAVQRLRAAGAVIVGKTRLAEFAYSPGSNNPHYGATRNPHDPARDAGGSSSGSGAAVGAGMVYAALGTDTGGSIRIPGSLCGIVGLKPTFGRVDLAGAFPLAWSLDHIGPMTRSVADAALMIEALASPEWVDRRTRPSPVSTPEDGLDSGVRGLRIGVLTDDGGEEPLGTPEAERAWRAGLGALAEAGATLVPIELKSMARIRVVNGALLAMEAAVLHRGRLRDRAGDYGEFARLRLLAAHAYAPGAYIRVRQARAVLRGLFELDCRNIDLLSTPTMPGPAPPLGVPASTRFTAPFNLLGWPAITVPVGTTAEGLPLGLQLVGRPWDEATLLRAARVVEAGAA
jgi:Asp-tRNA(Asn)/Glu-tRNA(Gln) amidotransferase A subunit family amidase